MASTASEDHPRIRGEHWPPPPPVPGPPGSSPHTRGAPPADLEGVVGERIIPAYAGSTRVCEHHCREAMDHPRIRGEHAALASQAHSIAGSSPHTRGALLLRVRVVDRRRIIPAYAGSTGMTRRIFAATWDHPRIRGEHRGHHVVDVVGAGSSPHTRGAPVCVEVVGEGSGIIPAYAGSTARGASGGACRADHPRIRGEHRRPAPFEYRNLGSSPHTRGAPFDKHMARLDFRIIPAYAGST